MLYSRDQKFVVFCFALLLPQNLDKFQNQCQFWKLLVLTISKHPLHVQFDQVLAEIMEVKDTRYNSFIFMSFDLLEMKITEIWTICSKNCSVHHPPKVPISTRIILRNTSKRSRMFYQLLFTQNVQISIIFLSVKSIVIRIKKRDYVSLTSNISAKTWSNCTSRGRFAIVRASRFQN